MNSLQERIYRYYNQKESKLGYKFIMRDSKHLGYYPDKVANISEKEAQEYYQDIIARSIELKPGQMVFDAGCGRGVTACYLASKYGASVSGIDIVDFEIETANKKAYKFGVSDRVNFSVGDYSRTKFEKDTFDAVYANETLSHVPDLTKVFQEFFRVLKPGGRIALLEYVLSDDEFFSDSDLEELNFVIDNSAMVGLKQFRLNKIIPLLMYVGFINTKEVDATDYTRPSFRRLYNISKPFYSLIKLLNLRKKFINATSAATLYPMVEKGLIHFYVYTAQKPI